MRRIVLIVVLLLSLIAVAARAAYPPRAFLPIIFKLSTLTTPVPTQTPSATPHPSGIVEILPNYTWFIDSGNLVIMGEVQNNTTDYADLIEITVNIYNSLDQLIEPDTGYTYLNNALAAGDKTFFMLSVPEPSGWSYFEFVNPTYVVGGDPAPDLKIQNDGSTWDPGSSLYYLWAEVRNEDIYVLTYSHVIATIYDSSGKVIAGGYVPLDQETLYPGQQSGFMTYFTDQDYSNVTYRLQADAWRP